VINFDTGSSALRVVTIDDVKSQDVVRFQQPDGIVAFGGVAWTPDGRYILYLKTTGAGPELETQLWRVPSAGGEPQQLGLTMDRFWDLRLHPDGKLRDLVKEQGPLVGGLDKAHSSYGGAGEGPFLVAEELALKEGLGDGS